MSKKLELNKAIKIDTIKELMELSVEDSAERTAFEYIVLQRISSTFFFNN